MKATLGAYELESELGRGGMGTVFIARHLPTGARRALKVLAGARDPDAVERFRREARALASAAGPGLVPIHESGEESGRLWYAMDLMPGGSLRARLSARGALPWREAVALVLEVARGLARGHALGLVHRDVKPENILLDEQGAPRLADFGCVRDLGRSALTEPGSVLGTIGYMPPEQLDGEPVDARADVFALAAILHELVAGTRPFEASSLLNLYREMKRPRRPLAGA